MKEDGLEKIMKAYTKISQNKDIPKEVGLAMYGMLAEQLPEEQKKGMYAALSIGYAKLAEELDGDAKDTAMAASQMYMAQALDQYQSIIQAKQQYTPIATPYQGKAASTKAA
jgi:hypothetical protein